jgi:gluconate 2-dehydrogenase gamma chain
MGDPPSAHDASRLLIPVLRRREFLVAVSAALAASACGGPGGRWRALKDDEARTLAALCDVIVPADEYPSATEAGAIEFFDRWLAHGGAEELVTIRAGLAATEAIARAEHGRGVADLDVSGREALVRRIESGGVPKDAWRDVTPDAFFDVLLTRTMHAYYSDPRHGGNRDRVSWRMVGLPDPPVRGRHKEG